MAVCSFLQKLFRNRRQFEIRKYKYGTGYESGQIETRLVNEWEIGKLYEFPIAGGAIISDGLVQEIFYDLPGFTGGGHYLLTYVDASINNEEKAIKIANDRFAKYEAEQLGL